MVSASVNVHGQVTLPAELRRKFGISEGSVLSIEAENNGIMLKKAFVVEEAVLKEIAAWAKSKKLTRKKIVEASRRIGRQLYKSEYPEDV
ncbi:TPA: AbrB/MazE/SpoVT family DNA-binding domain-containing protein [Candidatus Micrarchaeota archaeon]|nr:AbrB/MazE/SpoVT family DNA-binding domain-containing protein [Candidatus Micrarchaeota archaeon]